MDTAIDRQRHGEPTRQGPSGPRTSRNRHLAAPPPRAADVDLDSMARLDRVYEVLEMARTVLTRGWLQHGWYTRQARPQGMRSTGNALHGMRRLLADRSPDPTEVTSACLVAAVAVAAHRPGARVDVMRDAGPALGVVWETLEAAGGRAGGGGRAVPGPVRVHRMRELTRWNDTPGRTRDEVLTLLDQAISRTITSAVGRSAVG